VLEMANEQLETVPRWRRGLRLSDDRIAGLDMRTRQGRRFRQILRAVIAEFGDGDPVRAGEIARLRLIIEKAQTAVIAGDRRVGEEDLVRFSNVRARLEREMREAARPAREQTSSRLDAMLDGAA
jgi:hypothetical protein